MENKVTNSRGDSHLQAGDLVREVSIRALKKGSPYQLGIVLSIINFDRDVHKNSAKIKWPDCADPLWHPTRRLEKMSD
tara:strand:- start:1143 stop:1376 length:234 start_codon:yes stop_codon:yes gene_type:complete